MWSIVLPLSTLLLTLSTFVSVSFSCRFSFTSNKVKKCQERLVSSCIVLSGHLTKSPPSKKLFSGSWMRRYFVLYDPTLGNGPPSSAVDGNEEDKGKCLYYYKHKNDDASHSKYILLYAENFAIRFLRFLIIFTKIKCQNILWFR